LQKYTRSAAALLTFALAADFLVFEDNVISGYDPLALVGGNLGACLVDEPFSVLVLLLGGLLANDFLLGWAVEAVGVGDSISDVLDEVEEEFLHVLSGFGGDLDVGNAQLVGPLPALRVRDLPVVEVDLVAYEEDEALAAFVLVEEIGPHLDVGQAVSGGDVEDNECAVGVLEVAGDEGAEAFLPGSVPKLQAVALGLVTDVLGEEVDADGGLGGGACTFAVSSKRSWMYFSMMLDFPTA
jgi:hypothetical protein